MTAKDYVPWLFVVVTLGMFLVSQSRTGGPRIQAPIVPLTSEVKPLLTWTNRTTVILAASLHANARASPYVLYILPVARSWVAQGFEVIVTLTFFDEGNPAETEFVRTLKEQLRLAPHVQVIEFPAPNQASEVSVSQVVRLFLPIILDDWPDDEYIRLSDSDMMIFKRGPFEPKNLHGIDVYNGQCCYPEVPMHSIGMQRKLWVSLFEPYLGAKPEGEQKWNRYTLSLAIMRLLKVRFHYNATFVGHGQHLWGMDQNIAGEVVEKFKKNGSVTTSPVTQRSHWPFQVSPNVVECHLAGIPFSAIEELRKVIGADLGKGLDVIAAKYTASWLEPIKHDSPA